MASSSFYAQINLALITSSEDPGSGFIGLFAKSDGLYARMPSSLDDRLLSVKDIGVNVAAFNHTHNYDNYEYWNCIGGGSTTQIPSKYNLNFTAGTGIDISGDNPLESTRRLIFAVTDDIVRKTGSPGQYEFAIFTGSNVIQGVPEIYLNSLQITSRINGSISGYNGISLINNSSYSAYNGILQFHKSISNNAITSGTVISQIEAYGNTALTTEYLVGAMMFTASENFSSTSKGTTFQIDTFSEGSGGSLATRILIAGTGNVRMANGLILGTTGWDPISTLHVVGSVGAQINSTSGNLTLTSAHFTVIITGAHTLTLPAASDANKRIYIIVNKSGGSRTISSYLNFTGTAVTSIANATSIIIQSNGTNWHQIN